jgi:queuine/archaeosine tRNA-ribosyltransferase
MALDVIKTARKITQDYFLHVFGKFLHPRLLKPVIEIGADSVDGFGYILSSVRGLYTDIQEQQYDVIANITEDQLKKCSCPACQENLLQDFQRGDKDAQYLLIIHNIHALIQLKEQYIRELKKEENEE